MLVDFTIVDQVLAYNSSISPDGRFIAFTKFFPANHPVEPMVYLVYDTTVAPIGNRMATSDVEDIDAGWAVFPNENRQELTYDLSRFDLTNRHFVRSPLAWLDSSHLTFLDLQGDKVSAVLVGLSSGAPSAAVTVEPLDESALVDANALGHSIHPVEIISADSFELITVGSGSIQEIVHLTPQPELRVSTVTVQF